MARAARGRPPRGQALRTAPVVPAYLERDAAGVSRAPEFSDIYHPRHGALEQARRVFLGGNALPARWQDRERFVILETGFGLGNNFLATWLAWRDDARRCPRLRFLSIELRPPSASDLAAVPRDPRLAPLAAQLAAAWPPLTCNLHHLSFESGQVQLLLAFGDVAAWLPQIEATVDAFFLDGFAPAKNPAMWQPRLFKAMARIAAPQATAATWSSARAVRDGFRTAGPARRLRTATSRCSSSAPDWLAVPLPGPSPSRGEDQSCSSAARLLPAKARATPPASFTASSIATMADTRAAFAPPRWKAHAR
jgi:tRNA U34 5-methylaminomethyl-2-thiouridine-forming methyltransferase MnmC